MSSSLEKLISILDGSNYLTWADVMKSYLRSQENWQIVTGGYAEPRDPGTGATTDVRKDYQDNLLHWKNKDDAAFGTILL